MSWKVFSDSPDTSTTCAQATRSFGTASAGPGSAAPRLQRQGITSPPLYYIVPAHARQACSLLTGQARSAGYRHECPSPPGARVGEPVIGHEWTEHGQVGSGCTRLVKNRVDPPPPFLPQA